MRAKRERIDDCAQDREAQSTKEELTAISFASADADVSNLLKATEAILYLRKNENDWGVYLIVYI